MKQKNSTTDELTAGGFRLIALFWWCGASVFTTPKFFFAIFNQPDISVLRQVWFLASGILPIVLAVIAIVPPRLITRYKTIFVSCFTLALFPIAFALFKFILVLRSGIAQRLSASHALPAVIVFIVYYTVIVSLPSYLYFHWKRRRNPGMSQPSAGGDGIPPPQP